MSEIIVNPGQPSAGLLGLNIIGEGTVKASQTSPTGPVVVTGSNLDDTIDVVQPKGTTVVQISGNGGNDSFSGAGGNDTLTGGDGEDVIRGNGGNAFALCVHDVVYNFYVVLFAQDRGPILPSH